MSGLVRCRSSARGLVAARLGACSQSLPITPKSNRISPPSSSRTVSTNARPTLSIYARLQPRSSAAKTTSIAGTESAPSLLPPLQVLRHLYKEATSRGFSSSSSLSANPPDVSKPSGEKYRQSLPHQGVSEQWRISYEKKQPINKGRKAEDEQRLLESRAAEYRAGELPNQWILWLIGGINVLVFGAWQYAVHAVDRFKDPRPYFNMYHNFICSLPNLAQGRYWTILTSCFSHQDLGHLAMNLVSFFFLAPPVLTLLGPKPFALLYLGAGVGAAVFSLSWKRYVTPWIYRNTWTEEQQRYEMQSGAHGASGSIFGVITTFALVNPRQIFLLFFIVPIPAWVCVPGIFAWDLYSAWGRPGSGTDSAAHVGGAICGALFWRFKLRGFRL